MMNKFHCFDEKNINELWTRIYKEFFIISSYKQCMDIDFELYDDKDTEIWIPILFYNEYKIFEKGM